MEDSAFPNISKNRMFLHDLEDRSIQYIHEVKMFLEVIRNRIKIEQDYYDKLSNLIPTEFLHKDCLIK